MEVEKLENEIGYKFKNKKLLQTAMTHTSYANERKVESNEKLEFLGDSILGFVSSKYMYEKYLNLREGELTKVRAAVVCENSLFSIAQKHKFDEFIRLGKSERKNGKTVREAIMADSVEAVIAAMFLDGGLEQAEKFIIENLKDSIEIATKHIGQKDYKTVLQEILQKNGNVHIEYKIIKEMGPEHDKTFCAEVYCNGKSLAVGEGKSKKNAEIAAAKVAVHEINNEN